MSALVVRRSRPLRGALTVASDRTIGQEALLWAALSDGTCTLRGLSAHRDHELLAAGLRALGVSIVASNEAWIVRGVGRDGLRMPPSALDAEGSRSTLELLTALLCGQRFGTRITARGALAQRSLSRLVTPLRERGAMVAAAAHGDDDVRAPVSVAPLLADERLREIEIEIALGDADAKRALLITGLFADGITAINEGVLSRDHTERALMALGLSVETIGGMSVLDTSHSARIPAFDWLIPGDFSTAAFVVAAACSIPGSDVLIRDVGLNPTRTAFLTLLGHAGADVTITPKGDKAGNEPVGDIQVRASKLRRFAVGGELAIRLHEEVLPCMALALFANGRSSFRDLTRLRGERPDVLGQAALLVRAFGGECTDYEDGCDIDPAATLGGARVTAELSENVALLALVLGSVADGETRIENACGLHALYPGLIAALRSLGAAIEEEETRR